MRIPPRLLEKGNFMAENIITRDVTHDIQTSYLEYSMDVIIGRALPDIRDGCKPVHRRILYAMNETGNTCNAAYKKSARTVGEVLGKYHPHGDSSVYDAMVRMAQPFSLRYPLVDGHGNFGSIDGDSAAAMRYTEARMSKLADSMMEDIDKDTVDMMGNYDETLKEPTILPSKLPNMLVNGTQGIAVGFASNMPPHNLTEVTEAIIAKIDDPSLDSLALMKYVKGPDFPGGGTILGTEGIVSMYTTGKGRIDVRADYVIEDVKGGRTQIVFTNVPYQVVKSQEVSKIEELVKDGTLKDVADVRDESTAKDGSRIVVELKRTANSARIIRQIYKKTHLQDTFCANMIALLPKAGKLVPHLFTLSEMVEEYIKHRQQVVSRKYKFLLGKARDRKHILDGLVKAVDCIDEIVSAIRASKDKEEAKSSLCQKFGFDDVQALAILAYQLQRLSGLEITKLRNELSDVENSIRKYEGILSSDKTILAEVKKDCLDIIKSYGDERITKIGNAVSDDNDDEAENIEDKEMVVSVSSTGYIKSVPLDAFSAQKRGGKGVKGVKAANVDTISQMIPTSKRNILLCIGSDGKAYKLPVADIEESARTARGQYVNNLIEAPGDVSVVSVIGIKRASKDDKPEGCVLFFTMRGEVKKIEMSDLLTSRRCVQAIKIKEDDAIINAVYAEAEDGLAFVATSEGKLLKFNFGKLRSRGRASSTQRCMRIADGDYVVSADVIVEGRSLLTVTNTGIGKKSSPDDYREAGLGGQGVTNYRTTKDTKVASVVPVNEEDDILVACDNGKLIRVHADAFRSIGRTSKGNKLVNLEPHESVSCVNTVLRQDSEEAEEAESES